MPAIYLSMSCRLELLPCASIRKGSLWDIIGMSHVSLMAMPEWHSATMVRTNRQCKWCKLLTTSSQSAIATSAVLSACEHVWLHNQVDHEANLCQHCPMSSKRRSALSPCGLEGVRRHSDDPRLWSLGNIWPIRESRIKAQHTITSWDHNIKPGVNAARTTTPRRLGAPALGARWCNPHGLGSETDVKPCPMRMEMTRSRAKRTMLAEGS